MSMALSLHLTRKVLAAVDDDGLPHRQAVARFSVSAASVSLWRGRRASRALGLWAATAGRMSSRPTRRRSPGCLRRAET